MKSFIAALRSLVLPFGATTGARIVLDGVAGIIRVYNALNVVVGEINGATGFIEAGGGAVQLNENGVHVDGVSTQYDINGVAGFLARQSPDDGSSTQITPGAVFLTPEDPSPLGTAVDFAVSFVGYDNPGAANEAPYLQIQGVEYTGKSSPSIAMVGQAANDANPDSTSRLDIYADDINFNVGPTNPSYQRGEYGSFLLSFGPAASATVVVTYAKTYTTPPLPHINIDTAPASTARWVPRAITRTTTGFTVFVFAADAVANTWVNVPVSWDTTEQH